ncbi:MAG: endonuclease/exonuclease/phosphatase family protein [Planctomycetota bacterium]
MPRCILALLLAALFVFSASAQEPVRFGTWNVEVLGTPGSTQWDRAISVLGRVGADVVAVQEIDSIADVIAFPNFALTGGYPFSAVSATSGTLSGDLYNGLMSIHPIVFSSSHSAASISGDSNANDITRDIFEAHVQIPNAADVLGVFVVHLKASSGGTNDFRRAVEIIRLKQVVDDFKAANPQAPYIVCGDFNDDILDGGFGNSFTSLPGGLPSSYDLGNDMSFPIVYEPFQTFLSAGDIITAATQEDSTTIDATRISGRRLDYIIYGGGLAVSGDEVYNSARDNGVDDTPIGNWLNKFGSPLPSSYSLDAADHYLVFADATVPSSNPIAVQWPGSGDDFVMETSVNAGVFATGPGQDELVAITGNSLNVHYFSPSETLSGPLAHAIIVAQLFTPAGLAPTGIFPGMWFDLSGAAIELYNGLNTSGGFMPFIPPFFGGYHSFTIPAGFGGTSVMIQTVVISGNTIGGFVGFSDGHRLNILF